MNFRTTGLLLACVAVAGGLFWWSRSSGHTPVASPEAEPLVAGRLLGVAVRFASREFELKDEGDGWAQTSPTYAPLKPEAGRAWIDAIAALRPLQEIQPGVGDTPGLAGLALAPPAAHVTAITDQGAIEFALGDQTLAGTGYVRLDDGRIVLVPDDLHNLVYGPPPTQSFADTLPLPPLAALNQITFTRGRDTLTIYRRPHGWSLLPGAMRRVRPEVIDALVWLTADTPILRHRDQVDDPARYGLRPPRAALTFTGPDRPTFRLELGRSAAVEQGAMFARLSRDQTPGPVVALPIERTKIAFAPLGQFRDPRVFEASTDAVTELRITGGNVPEIALLATGAGLAYADPSTISKPPADQLLDAVLALRSTGPVPGPSVLGEDPVPRFTIDLRWGVTRRVQLGVYRTPSGWFAHRDDEPDPTDLTEAETNRLLTLLPARFAAP
ncbi:MAG: hypothetical protein AAGE65_07175 [Planctomycetota bacterium]